MEVERNRVHSIEVIEFHLSVLVSAFGPLSGRIVVNFTNGVAFFSLFLDSILDFSRICEDMREKVFSAFDRARRVVSWCPLVHVCSPH